MKGDNLERASRISYFPLKKPSSIILSSSYPVNYGFNLQYLSGFSTTESLTLLNDNPIALPGNNLGTMFPQLSVLRIFVKTFPNGFQPASLQLYLRHEEGESLPIVDQDINLPKLKILGITFPGAYLLNHLQAMSINTLILYGPPNLQGLNISSMVDAKEVYRRLRHVEFDNWGPLKTGGGSLGAVGALGRLAAETTALKTVKFLYIFIEGEALVSLMSVPGHNPASRTLKGLEEMTLSRVTGINRSQCDELVPLVKKLNIYV